MGLTIVPGNGTASAGLRPTETYVVQMALDPVVGPRGLSCRPCRAQARPGHKVGPAVGQVVSYVDHQEARHAAALSRVGGDRKLYDFSYSFDGSPLGWPSIKESVLDPGDRAVLWTTHDDLVAFTSLLPTDSGWICQRHGHHRLRLGHGYRPLQDPDGVAPGGVPRRRVA